MYVSLVLNLSEYNKETQSYGTVEIIALEDVIKIIKSESLKNNIEEIRAETDSKTQKELKFINLPKLQPCYLAEHSLSIENNDNIEATGIIHFDIDDITLDVAESIKTNLINNIPQLVYAYISPRNGLKFAVNSDFDCSDKKHIKTEYEFAYDLASDLLESIIDLPELDDGLKSIEKGSYMSFDKDAYINVTADKFIVSEKSTEMRIEREKIEKEKGIDQTYFGNITATDEDVIAALSSIDPNMKQDDRYRINNFIISHFGGSRAESILMEHWQTKNRKSLREDIKRDIQHFKVGKHIEVGTLLFEAKKNGFDSEKYKSFSSTLNIKSTPIKKGEKPFYDRKLYSVDDGKEKLEKSVKEFFETKENTFINVTAGSGKTHTVAKSIYKSAWGKDKGRMNIAVYVRSNDNAQEFKDKFYEIREKEIKNSGLSRFEYLKKHHMDENNFVTTITGRDNNRSEGDKITHGCIASDKEKKISSFCTAIGDNLCPYINSCSYVGQFSSIYNIRIYYHGFLFEEQKKSFFEKNDGNFITDRKVKKWKPDYIVIDEDIIVSKIANTDQVVKSSKSDSLRSIGKIIKCYENNGHNLRQAVKDNYKQLSKDENIFEFGYNYKNNKDYGFMNELLSWSEILQKNDAVDSEKFLIKDNKAQGNHLFYYGRRKFRSDIKDVPKLFLDASGNNDIAKDILGEDLKFIDIDFAYNDNVEVIQVENKRYSKKNFVENPKLNDDIVEFIKRTAEDNDYGVIGYRAVPFKKQENGFVRLTNNGKVIIDTIDGVEYYRCITNDHKLIKDRVGYFGHLRGSNRFENLDMLFVIGSHMAPVDAVSDMYRQLYGRNVVHADNVFYPENIDTHKERRIFRFKDGQHRAIDNRAYDNDRMENIMRLLNDAETYQAVHRLRLIHKDKKKTVYVLSNRVLNITIDKLIRSKDGLQKTIHGKTLDKIEKIANDIKKEGSVSVKQAALSKLTGYSISTINNLKRSIRDSAHSTLDAELEKYGIIIENGNYVFRDD